MTIKGRPFTTGQPFQCYRDPSRKRFGFIRKIVVTYRDGQQPLSEVFTMAQFNKLRRASMSPKEKS